MIHHFWLFVAAELLFSATPGPAVMLVSATGFRKDFAGAVAACLGIQTGNAIYILVTALGLSAIILASGPAFTILKLTGAAYLIWLGLRTLWHAQGAVPNAPTRRGSPFLQGIVTQLSNPKAMLYFGAFLPQFLNRDAPLWPQYLLMFAVMAFGESTILGFYGWLGAQGQRFTGMALWRERISGAVMVGIGTIFAVAQRP